MRVRTMARRHLVGLALAIMVFTGRLEAAAFTPPYYSATEIRALVVDKTTGQPLAGVAVVAQWVLRDMAHSHGPTLHIVEALTDGDGRFVFPAWGPKLRPPFTDLGHHAPEILVFR